MRLYDLFNEFGSSLDMRLIKEKIKRNCFSPTDVENVIIETRILFNDDYPTYYWKLIAGIHFIVFKFHMIKITSDYVCNIFNIDSNRIRSSSEIEIDLTTGILEINSIYAIYINFILSYKPFKSSNIDRKLKKLGYDLNLFSSIKDKVIVFVKDFANNGRLHPAEVALCSSLDFLSSLNFLSFYESLSNFSLRKENYITQPLIDYSLLASLTQNFIADNNESTTFLNSLLSVRYGENKDIAKIILRRIVSGDFDISISDLYLTFDLCVFIFILDAERYIHTILFMMKLKNIPIGTIIIYNPLLASTYFNIELTLSYAVFNCCEIGISQIFDRLSISYDYKDIDNVMSKCYSVEMFKIVCEKYNYKNGMSAFIIENLKNGITKFPGLEKIKENLEESISSVKYPILKIHIEHLNYEFIDISISHVDDYDFCRDEVAYSIGRSESLEMFNYFYSKLQISNSVITNVILGALSKGNDLFMKYFSNEALTIPIDDIIGEIIHSNNIDLLSKYRSQMSFIKIEEWLLITIDEDNIAVFLYLWKNTDHSFFNFFNICLKCIVKNNIFILNLVLRDSTLSVNFFVRMLEKINIDTNIHIFNILFSYIGEKVDMTLHKVQLFKLKKIINRILLSENKRLILWLKENISILPLLTFVNGINNKRLKIYHCNSSDDYLSSDED